jgi:prevent-host-death family protein
MCLGLSDWEKSFLSAVAQAGTILVRKAIFFEAHMDETAKQNLPSLRGHWVLKDAKARFSELVRRVRSEGPQHVTDHGRDVVVVLAVEEFRRLQGHRTGKALIDVLSASPYPEIDIIPSRSAMPVREITL